MKPSNRIRSNRNAARTSPQAKTTRNHKPQIRAAGQLKTERGENSIAVILFDNVEELSLTPGINLTSGEFQAIVKDACVRGETVDAWLQRTFEETPALRSLKPVAINPPAPAKGDGQITLHFFNGNGKTPLASVDLPKAHFEAIKRKAASAGFTFEQFFNKGFNRILNTIEKENPDAGRGPVSGVAAEALAAIDELKDCGYAAIALAMMNASQIKGFVKAYAGWEDLERFSFEVGNLGLPRIMADQFERDLCNWHDEIFGMLHNQRRPDVRGNTIENAVNALVHLVKLQGNEISNRNNNSSFAASFIVIARLKEAFDRAWKAAHSLYVAVDAKTAAPLRQEVAS